MTDTELRWENIEGVNFEIGSNGTVRSRADGSLLYGHSDSRGKLKVNLRYEKDGMITQKTFGLHLLVAKAFLRTKRKDEIVIFLDADGTNCNAKNLKWGHKKGRVSKKLGGSWDFMSPKGKITVRNLNLFCREHPELHRYHMGRLSKGEITEYQGYTLALK